MNTSSNARVKPPSSTFPGSVSKTPAACSRPKRRAGWCRWSCEKRAINQWNSTRTATPDSALFAASKRSNSASLRSIRRFRPWRTVHRIPRFLTSPWTRARSVTEPASTKKFSSRCATILRLSPSGRVCPSANRSNMTPSIRCIRCRGAWYPISAFSLPTSASSIVCPRFSKKCRASAPSSAIRSWWPPIRSFSACKPPST